MCELDGIGDFPCGIRDRFLEGFVGFFDQYGQARVAHSLFVGRIRKVDEHLPGL
jgi:hypothetical protein